ncbi:MAG: hypothetical protein WDO18_07710 [Acidobacteriota bacterium]
MTNPQRSATTINARLGIGALVGASTEAGANVFDLFIAIPKATAALSNATLTGPYYISSLEFPSGGLTNIRETNFKITANGSGSIAESAVAGQARNLSNRFQTQTIAPLTYLVSPDASGVLNFPLASGQTETSQLIAGPQDHLRLGRRNVFHRGLDDRGFSWPPRRRESLRQRRIQRQLDRLLLQRGPALRR